MVKSPYLPAEFFVILGCLVWGALGSRGPNSRSFPIVRSSGRTTVIPPAPPDRARRYRAISTSSSKPTRSPRTWNSPTIPPHKTHFTQKSISCSSVTWEARPTLASLLLSVSATGWPTELTVEAGAIVGHNFGADDGLDMAFPLLRLVYQPDPQDIMVGGTLLDTHWIAKLRFTTTFTFSANPRSRDFNTEWIANGSKKTCGSTGP